MIKEIDARLYHWADSVKHTGSSQNSILAALIKGKGEVIRSTNNTTCLIDEDCEEMDCCIAKLGSFDKKLIRVHYLAVMTIKQRADRMQVSIKKYYRMLHSLHVELNKLILLSR